MRVRFIGYLIGLILLIFNLMLLSKIKQTRVAYSRQAEVAKDRYDSTIRDLFLMLESEGMAVNGGIILESEEGVRATLQELISDSLFIVFRYSELDCNKCVINNLGYLNVLKNSIDNANIIILTTYGKLNDLILFKRVNHINFPVYNISEYGLGLPAEKSGMPFLFMMDGSLVTRYVHFPDKENPRLTNIFLNLIPRHYRRISSIYTNNNPL